MEKTQISDTLKSQISESVEKLIHNVTEAIVSTKSGIFDLLEEEFSRHFSSSEKPLNLSITVENPLNLSIHTTTTTIPTAQNDDQFGRQLNLVTFTRSNNNNSKETLSAETNNFILSDENLPESHSINVVSTIPNHDDDDDEHNQCCANSTCTCSPLTSEPPSPSQQPAHDHSQTPPTIKTVSYHEPTASIKQKDSKISTEFPVNLPLPTDSALASVQPEFESIKGVCSNKTIAENGSSARSPLKSTVRNEAPVPEVLVKAEPFEGNSVEVPIPLNEIAREVSFSTVLPKRLKLEEENEHSSTEKAIDNFCTNVEATLAEFETETQVQEAILIENEREAEHNAMSIDFNEDSADFLLNQMVFVNNEEFEDEDEEETLQIADEAENKKENKEKDINGQIFFTKKLKSPNKSDLSDKSLEPSEPLDENFKQNEHQRTSPLRSTLSKHSPTLQSTTPVGAAQTNVINASANSAFERIIPRAAVSEHSSITAATCKVIPIQPTISFPNQTTNEPKENKGSKRRRSSQSVSPTPIEKKRERTQSVPASKVSSRKTVKTSKPTSTTSCATPTKAESTKSSKSTLICSKRNAKELTSKLKSTVINSTVTTTKTKTTTIVKTTVSKSFTPKDQPSATAVAKTPLDISSLCLPSRLKRSSTENNFFSDQEDENNDSRACDNDENYDNNNNNNWYCVTSSKFNDIKTIEMKCHDSECKRMFEKMKQHKAHMLTAHNRRPYSCQICPVFPPVTFQNKDLWDKHMEVSHKEGPYKCNSCSEQMSNAYSLFGHYVFHHEKGTFGCTVCEYSDEYRVKISNHNKRVHSDIFAKNYKSKRQPAHQSRSYLSIRTGKGEEKGNQVSPQLSPSEVSSYPSFIPSHSFREPEKVKILAVNCLRCSKEFHNTEELNDHMVKEHGIQAFPCHVRKCTRNFINHRELFNHVEISHRQTRTGATATTTFLLDCAFCIDAFTSYEELKKHTLERHQGGKFICARCPERSQLQPEKTREAVIAHYDKNHIFKLHVEKIFCPEECGMEFSFEKNDESLYRHLREKHSLKRYLCFCCESSFDNNNQLENHISSEHSRRMHKNEWQCKICKYSDAKTHYDLSRHIFLEHHKGVFYCAHKDCQGQELFKASRRGEVYKHYDKKHLKLDDSSKSASLVKEVREKINELFFCQQSYWQQQKPEENYTQDIDERIQFAHFHS